MKKVFAIILIVCLAVGVAFAAKSENEIKVGAQAGYGADFIKLTQNDNIWSKTNNGGFYFAGTGEYSFTDAISAKVELGLNTMGKAKNTGKVSSLSYETTADEASPLMFSVYAGAQYNIELSDDINLGLGAGWDMMIGKESNADDAKTNAAMGLGFEAVGAYELQDNLAITLGAKFGWHFINTDDQIKEDLENVNTILSYFTSDDVKVAHTTFKIFAGVTYSL